MNRVTITILMLVIAVVLAIAIFPGVIAPALNSTAGQIVDCIECARDPNCATCW